MPSVLGNVCAAQPSDGWLCKIFSYETTRSHTSTEAWSQPHRAVIHCAYSSDHRHASVNFQSHEDSGWHGKCDVHEDAILLSFNARGDIYVDEMGVEQLYPMHAAFLKKTEHNVYQGFDYASRAIKMSLLGEYVFEYDSWQVVQVVNSI